jgi:hypothetical protein
MRSTRAVLLLVVVVACARNSGTTANVSPPPAQAAAAASFGGANLPPGRELTDLRNSCQICHSPDMWYTQRLSKATWQAEVTKMMGFGAPIPPADKAHVVAYLAKYLGPTVPRRASAPLATPPPITYTAAPLQ